jgi:hypothetical protein
MSFGLSNVERTFERTTNTILSDLIDQNILDVYLDDILVRTQRWPQHMEILSEVLKQLKRYNLQQPHKCKCRNTLLKALGFIILVESIQIDPAKPSQGRFPITLLPHR